VTMLCGANSFSPAQEERIFIEETINLS